LIALTQAVLAQTTAVVLIRHSPDSRLIGHNFPSHRAAPQRNSIEARKIDEVEDYKRRQAELHARHCELNGPNLVSLSPLSGAGSTVKLLSARTR
jgi:hypothetical protein